MKPETETKMKIAFKVAADSKEMPPIGPWYFRSREKAERHARALRATGYEARIIPLKSK